MCNVVTDKKRSVEKVRQANAFARLGSRHIDSFVTIVNYVPVIITIS
jgi:hypothetical protein